MNADTKSKIKRKVEQYRPLSDDILFAADKLQFLLDVSPPGKMTAQDRELMRVQGVLRRHAKYIKVNPLGGQAKVFDVIADRIRRGDDYKTVLGDYQLQVKP